MKKYFYVLVVCLLFISCKIAPKEIEYGVDVCHFCKMTIVDKTHAAEVVTKKGRAYKYDAIECMINDISKDGKEQETALFLVVDYKNPGNLIDAQKATFLISEKIKSPMGANLSAFFKEEDITVEGQKFNWKEIKNRISK